MQRVSVVLGLWLVWTVFVVYGSLLPFDYKALTLDQAIDGFRHMAFLRLGIESRADWVANGVLYVPVGLLTTRLLLALFGGRGLPVAMLLALAFGVVLASAVEFAQQFFPSRTVSQNDVIAECIGTLLGVAVAPWLTPWMARLRGLRSLGGRRLLLGLLEVYLVVYLLQSLFPFDFLLDAQEWKVKLASDTWGWFVAGSSMQRGWMAALFLAIELLLATPIGVLLAVWWPGRRNMLLKTLMLGLTAGLVIELGQLAISSGTSQGASVVTRGLGAGLGWWCWQLWADEGGIIAMRRRLRRVSGLLLMAYLVMLVVVNGWLSHPWKDPAWAAQEWSQLRLMPFYYHYYTTEAEAVFSLGSVALMYLPVAIIGWARRWHPAASVLVAMAAALTIEVGKLFLGGLRADPSNPLIALAACWIVLSLIALIERAKPVPISNTNPAPGGTMAVSGHANAGSASTAGPKSAMTLAALAIVAVSLVYFPSQQLLVLTVLVLSALAVWIRPVLALALIPAALPIFDLAPWTGRFYWSEFDLLLLVVLAIGWLRTTPMQYRAGTGPARVLQITLWLFGISLAASAVRGVLPWQWPDLNSFNSYYSGFNALRIAKGAVWAVAFAALYRRVAACANEKFAVFAWGMSAGLMATVVVILWERMAFVGLFDFDADYRVTGPFSVMHTGGAYIECYLAIAAAFLIWLIIHTPGVLVRVCGATLLVLTTYAMMVTYSRNGYAALLVVAIVMVGSVLIRGAGAAARFSWRKRAIGMALVVLMLAAAMPILRGTFALQRLDQIEADFATRYAHWKDALYMRDDDGLTAAIGMGLGRYPQTHYWRSAEPVKAASFGLAHSKAGNYLRLGTGSPVYVEQVVDAKPGQQYRLSLKLRSTAPATLGAALCEKWMLTSAACHMELLPANGTPSQWQTVSAMLSTEAWAPGPLLGARLVKFSLFSRAGPGVVEVTDLRIEAQDGTQLLHNGSFAQGLDRWFFSADVNPPWHIDSLLATVLFEQGWLGLIALGAAWAAALGLVVERTLRGDQLAPPLLAALLAFTVSGVFNTLIDAPRILMLILFLVWLGAQSGRMQTSRMAPTQVASG